MTSFITSSLLELKPVIDSILEFIPNYPLILLKGEMGSGKTTLIREFCNTVGVFDNVSSPTFTIINEYNTADNKKVYHADLYRISQIKELMDTGIMEYIENKNTFFIEWPELLEDFIDCNYMIITIETENFISRKYSFEFVK